MTINLSTKEHMNKQKYLVFTVICALVLLRGTYSLFATESPGGDISGNLQNGYRVLTVPVEAADILLTVYRGDYIKFDLGSGSGEMMLAIPSLAIQASIKPGLEDAPYFKMKEVGSYPFTLGHAGGVIRVVEFDRPQYAVLTAQEADLLIRNIAPLVLDVRTPQEYGSGHLENAILIPVQELQQRYTELVQYKDADIFIYCATGNRSTVAAKILIDNGFNRIHNLRYGIFDWVRQGYPVVR